MWVTRGSGLRQRGEGRALLLGCARGLAGATAAVIAAATGVSECTVLRAPARATPDVRVVGRLVGDARFVSLPGAPYRPPGCR